MAGLLGWGKKSEKTPEAADIADIKNILSEHGSQFESLLEKNETSIRLLKKLDKREENVYLEENESLKNENKFYKYMISKLLNHKDKHSFHETDIHESSDVEMEDVQETSIKNKTQHFVEKQSSVHKDPENLQAKDESLLKKSQIEWSRNEKTANELSKVKEEMSNLQKQIQTLKSEKDTISCKLSDVKKEKDNLFEDNQKLSSELLKIKKERENLQKELKKAKDNSSCEVSKVLEEKGNLQKEMQTLKSENKGLSCELSKGKEKIGDLNQQMHILKRGKEEISKELKRKVYFAHGDVGESNQEVINQYTSKLVYALLSKHGAIHLGKWDPRIKNAEGSFVIVFCLKKSRLHSDIDDALSEAHIAGAKSVCLVIMHSSAKHVKVTPSDNILSFTDYATHHINYVLDCVFVGKEGVYDCPTNKDSVEKLITYIQKEKSDTL